MPGESSVGAAQFRSAIDKSFAERGFPQTLVVVGQHDGDLAGATGRQVDVKAVLDPAVVGGVVARVGDEVFDGTVATRLEDAKRRLESV